MFSFGRSPYNGFLSMKRNILELGNYSWYTTETKQFLSEVQRCREQPRFVLEVPGCPVSHNHHTQFILSSQSCSRDLRDPTNSSEPIEIQSEPVSALRAPSLLTQIYRLVGVVSRHWIWVIPSRIVWSSSFRMSAYGPKLQWPWWVVCVV